MQIAVTIIEILYSLYFFLFKYKEYCFELTNALFYFSAEVVKKKLAGFDYENLMKKEYLEKINGVEILKDLHFFLLNVLNLIFSRAYYYFYCKKVNKRCAFCTIKVDFGGFEEKVNNNQDNKHFLKA